MSDKNLDIDGILDSKADAPEGEVSKKKSGSDEIDDLLASLKKDKKSAEKPKNRSARPEKAVVKDETDDVGAPEKKEKKSVDKPKNKSARPEKTVVKDETDEGEIKEKKSDRKPKNKSAIPEKPVIKDELDEGETKEKKSGGKPKNKSARPKKAVIADELDDGADEESGELKRHFGKAGLDFDDEEDMIEETTVRKSGNKSSGKGGSKKSSGKKKKKKRIGFNGSIFGGIILVTIILTVSMLLAVGGLTIGMEFYGIGKSENDISFNIPEGSTNEDIADLLFENGIINNKDLFLLAVRVMAPQTIYPGDITLKPSMPYSDIVEAMEVQRERYETVTITFTEGEYLIDIAEKLEENGVCEADDFLFEFNRNLGYKFENYLTDVENVFYAREGYFFPDTYEFYVNDTAFNIAKTIRDHYDSKLTDSMYKKMNDMGLSLNDTITLASIVQMEAASVDEMPNVASVFLNRLNDSDVFPMLQSDTTYKYINEVIVVMAGNDDTVAHYTEYYDTYAIDGLPSGPICNPGMDAINAVLNAADTNYYYFCNDIQTGETFYAETLEEHEQNLIRAGLSEGVIDDDDDDDDDDEDYDDGEGYYDDNGGYIE